MVKFLSVQQIINHTLPRTAIFMAPITVVSSSMHTSLMNLPRDPRKVERPHWRFFSSRRPTLAYLAYLPEKGHPELLREAWHSDRTIAKMNPIEPRIGMTLVRFPCNLRPRLNSGPEMICAHGSGNDRRLVLEIVGRYTLTL